MIQTDLTATYAQLTHDRSGLRAAQRCIELASFNYMYTIKMHQIVTAYMYVYTAAKIYAQKLDGLLYI